jgi:hypothetical protein
MSLVFRGKVQLEDINMGIFSTQIVFKAIGLNEITKEISEDSEEKISKN